MTSVRLSRREMLRGLSLAVATPLVARLGLRSAFASERTDRYTGLNTADYLGEVRIETTIEDEQVFTEGPAVDRAGHVFFTNVPAEKILRWDPEANKLSVFREQSNKANGLLFEPDGSLLACEGGAGRVTRTDMATGKITVVADRYNGHPFAAPNDLALDGAGRIYFTSRPGTNDPEEGNPNAVYRVDRDGAATQLLRWPEVHMPNGIVTSPDDKTLYVIEAHPDAEYNRSILAFDLKPDGSLANRRVLFDFYPGRSGDGMGIDRAGNLYVAAGLHKRRNTSETLDTRPGVHVISPEGKLLAFRETPEDTITNCTFGGEDLQTLYVTCGRFLLSLRTSIPGKPR